MLTVLNYSNQDLINFGKIKLLMIGGASECPTVSQYGKWQVKWLRVFF